MTRNVFERLGIKPKEVNKVESEAMSETDKKIVKIATESYQQYLDGKYTPIEEALADIKKEMDEKYRYKWG